MTTRMNDGAADGAYDLAGIAHGYEQAHGCQATLEGFGRQHGVGEGFGSIAAAVGLKGCAQAFQDSGGIGLGSFADCWRGTSFRHSHPANITAAELRSVGWARRPSLH